MRDPGDSPAAAEPARPAPPPGPSVQSLERTIAELEAAVAGYGQDWEPDGSEPSALTASAEPKREAAAPRPATSGPDADRPADVGAADDSGPEQEPEDWDEGLSLAESDTVIDEEALRDLVAELVREELQGPLGERITRNVRKLVRAEIARALAAQRLG